jgi:hypothetical protein
MDPYGLYIDPYHMTNVQVCDLYVIASMWSPYGPPIDPYHGPGVAPLCDSYVILYVAPLCDILYVTPSM